VEREEQDRRGDRGEVAGTHTDGADHDFARRYVGRADRLRERDLVEHVWVLEVGDAERERGRRHHPVADMHREAPTQRQAERLDERADHLGDRKEHAGHDHENEHAIGRARAATAGDGARERADEGAGHESERHWNQAPHHHHGDGGNRERHADTGEETQRAPHAAADGAAIAHFSAP
jgi:hypothetical protein